ncbi:hypothetical protein [Dyadobacter fermentans]|uniref:Uncharacterized protein n=1 Tax=Dyadobacter fermentans (strain ATCC 700827 / DSM 18053 / CIP 107007 / KCTC 52180 / NS114) TaxID=471854 RepID=C6VVF3_DYAFD|nr:hypothetical protein [Dyadobacter fermentans]ACT96683.1 hypothetical protein Dfer_5492 [Dyadobacter fermentans DSM 18053]
MSNLSLYNQPDRSQTGVAQQLSRTENQLISASVPGDHNLRIADMTGKQIGDIITAIVLKAAVRLGSKARDAEEQKIINAELNRDLITKLPGFTEREIMVALENGLDGMYLRKPDDPIIFTPSNFVQWCRSFVEQTKKPVMKKAAQLLHQQKDEEFTAPESEKLRMSHEFFLSILKRVLDGESYEDYGNVVYNFLDKIEFLGCGSEQKWRAMDQAKLRMIAEAREIKDANSQRSAVKNAMELIAKAENEKPDELIVSMAKRIIINEKMNAFREMPDDEQGMLLESIAERVDYMCIELKDPEQYKPDEE